MKAFGLSNTKIMRNEVFHINFFYFTLLSFLRSTLGIEKDIFVINCVDYTSCLHGFPKTALITRKIFSEGIKLIFFSSYFALTEKNHLTIWTGKTHLCGHSMPSAPCHFLSLAYTTQHTYTQLRLLHSAGNKKWRKIAEWPRTKQKKNEKKQNKERHDDGKGSSVEKHTATLLSTSTSISRMWQVVVHELSYRHSVCCLVEYTNSGHENHTTTTIAAFKLFMYPITFDTLCAAAANSR